LWSKTGGWIIRYNNEICELYKDLKLSLFTELKRLQWAGHVVRMEDNHIPKKVTQETIHVYGKRRIGKLRKRWEDTVREDANKFLGLRN
jgi:hypothetical protein